ncbi:hypothetical protein R1sor_009997 [Riccia sorocarpa]|uniref:Uncharacterized protein n=1 Tax=Riccia sorocarpa TaxID=122646 RepID=A0ABD3I0S0_9MARC
MKRVVSYGGPSGIPASQRLKLMLSMTAGMHLLANEVKKEQGGLLGPVVEPHFERIIHRTSGVTRNLSSSESFNGFANLRRDSSASTESSKLETSESCSQRGQYGEAEAGASVEIDTRNNPDLVGSSASPHLGLGEVRQIEDAGENLPFKRDHDPSSLDTEKVNNLITNSNDLTNIPALDKAADVGEVSQPGLSRLDECIKGNEFLVQVLGSDEAHGQRPTVKCPREQLQEGCHSETSSVSRNVDADHVGDLNQEKRLYEHARASTSSLYPTALVDRVDFCTLTESYEQAQTTNCNGDKVINESSVCRVNPRLTALQDLSQERDRREVDAALRIQSRWRAWRQGKEYRLLKHAAVRIQGWWKGQLQRKKCRIQRDAALRIQRWWKGRLQRREYRKLRHAVLRIQVWWKGCLRRREDQRSKEISTITASTRHDRELNKAAVVLQNSWRTAQSRRILKHLRIERTVKSRAASVIQAHFRGHCIRVQHKRWLCAALIIQKHWRCYNSLRQALADAAQEAEKRRLTAVITLQAYTRGFLVRQKLVRMHKAASRIQRQWKAYSQICTQAAKKLQACIRAFLARRKYAVQNKIMLKERAAVLIQAYARGHLVRCHLTVLHTAALIIQLHWRRYSQKHQLRPASPDQPAVDGPLVDEDSFWEDEQADILPQSGPDFIWVENDVRMECFDELLLLNGDDDDLLLPPKHEAGEFSSEVSRAEEGIDIAVDPETEDCGKPTAKDFCGDTGLRPLLNGELPAVPTGEVPVGKVSQSEDWTDLSVDHLDECLDTCLASLRSVPSDLSASIIEIDQCFPKFVILEEAHPSQRQTSASSYKSTSCVGGIEPVKAPGPVDSQAAINLPRLERAPSRKDVKHEHSRKVMTLSFDGHLNQTILSSRDSPQPVHESSAELSKGVLRSKAADQQVIESDQGGDNIQGKSRRTESLKRSEERLQQFAQVFLLQRVITLQQQRAQSTPPFPPPAHVGTGSSSRRSPLEETGSLSRRPGMRERSLNSVSVHHVSPVTSVHSQQVANQGNISHFDTSSGVRREVTHHQRGEASAIRQPGRTHTADVVVDMVLLLKKVEEVYGTSDIDREDVNHLYFPTRSGDIEEGGGPVLDRRKTSSTLGFSKSVSMSQISLPSVNAMLLVIIAMVVYTKTICQGILFRAKHPQKKS